MGVPLFSGGPALVMRRDLTGFGATIVKVLAVFSQFDLVCREDNNVVFRIQGAAVRYRG